MKKPIFSIIIAAYNVVEYLSDAIDSIISQWNDNYELIIVNDGSTDGTHHLLEEYQQKISSSNFIILNKENGGISSARNAGLSIAKGEYILFLDGDDFFVKNTLKIIKLALTHNNPDCLIIDFNYFYDHHKYDPTHRHIGIPEKKVLNVKEDNVVANIYRNRQLYSWKHIIRKSILDKLLSPEGFNYEDVRTITLHIDSCKTVYYLPIKAIQYRQREGSIMKSKNKKNILDLSSSLKPVTDEFRKRYHKIPDDIALEHSIFNLYIFTWACGDTLSNPTLNPKALHNNFVENFIYSNLVEMKQLKKEMKRDPKTWRKFSLFYFVPKMFFLAFYLRHNFNRTYKFLNKIRELIYST